MTKNKLGNFVNIKTGKLDANASSIDGKYPFFTCSREPLKISSYSYDCKCVLVAGNGDLNVKYYEGKFDAYQRTYIIESKDESILDTRYLYWYLFKYVEKLRELSIGGVIKYIKLNNLTDPIIPLPSLEDQKLIVKILDEADTLRQKRKQAISLLDEYLTSTFLEMFGDPVKNSKGWKVEKLGCLANEFKYGTNTISDANNLDHKMPILRIPNIIGGKINYTDLKYSVIDEKEKEKIRLRYGDLLFVRTNGNPAYIGRCAVFCDSIECGYASYLIRARLKIDSPVKSNFIRDVISFPTYRHLVIAKAKTTAGNYNINTESLKSLKIFLPPLDLQNKFTKIVEKSESLKQKMIIQSEELENQFQALMQRAFKGAL